MDTAAAEESLAGLGAAGSDAGVGIASSTDALSGLTGASQLAAGDLAGVGAVLSSASARAAGFAGAGLAVAGTLKTLTSNALESETATRRFETVLGDMADRIDDLSIAGFAGDLEELAERTGSSDEALRLAAARIFDLGRSADVAAPQIADTTEQVLLLATRASVLNPALGDAGAVAERLTGARPGAGAPSSTSGSPSRRRRSRPRPWPATSASPPRN